MSIPATVEPPKQNRLLNRFKSLYVSLYLTGAFAGTGYAIYQLVTQSFQWGWLGVLLTTLPFLTLLSKAFVLKSVARTSEHMNTNILFGAIGLGLAMAAWILGYDPKEPTLVAGGLFLGYLIYDFWYSNLEREESSLLAVGQPLPGFSVYRADGTELNSETLKGSPALILFFRGNWCPFCVAQIKEIVANYQQLSDKGVKTLFISPQTEKHTADLAKKFNVPCEFLSDRGNAAADALGIAADGGLPMGMEALGYDSDTVLPTALVVDASGKIIYSDQTANYRVRPEPQEYIAILDQYGL
ncbi:MAG: peroxiredoxin family protein [Pseudomonadales bacterium]|nr:peroxiredoxin family protein [Pseudomonadales bacterium]